jgi:hypothetical protein
MLLLANHFSLLALRNNKPTRQSSDNRCLPTQSRDRLTLPRDDLTLARSPRVI